MSTTMKAFTRPAFNLDASYPKPTLPTTPAFANHVLIKIHAAAINPVDYKVPKLIIGPIIGLDCSGSIVQVGSSVKHVAVGDAVYGRCQGSLCEYSVVDSKSLAIIPKGLSFEEAASMPTAYMTGLQALQKYGKSTPASKLLIIGASGGTGSAGAQLAKALNISCIYGICSTANVEFAREMGCTNVLSYNDTPDISASSAKDTDGNSIPKFDVIYDCATASGGSEDYRGVSLRMLVKNGQYVAINTTSIFTWIRMFMKLNKKNEHLFLVDSNTQDLNAIREMMESGKLKPIVQQVYEFTKVGVDEAFKALKGRRVKGKLVIKIVGDESVNEGEDKRSV